MRLLMHLLSCLLVLVTSCAGGDGGGAGETDAGDELAPGDGRGESVPDAEILTDTEVTPDADATGDAAQDLESAPDAEDVDLSPEPGTVLIIRDKWGVPHVLAESDYGAEYGYGYALAEDRLADVLDALWTAQGRRTEIDGEMALGIDRTMRLFRLTADVEKEWDKLSPEVRELVTGFVDGLNRYMEEHPEEVPAWAEPVKPWWAAGLGRLVFFIPQVSGVNHRLEGLCPELWEISVDLNDEHYSIGSNGWAAGPGKTTGGLAYMAGDPHLPYKYEFRLYEVHLRGATFEIAGAAPTGGPIPVMGTTPWVAWTWTSNGPHHSDVYRLTLDATNPGHYLLDGQSVAFETEEATYRMPDGSEQKETLYRSVQGPIACFQEAEGQAIAMRLTIDGQTGSPTQFWGMLHAHDLDEFDQAMAMLQVTHFNLVAADTSGNVEFHWNARVPLQKPGIDYGQPLDGSTSETLWAADEVIPYADLPVVRNPAAGWVQNCNNSPDLTTGTSDDPDPASFLPGVEEGGHEEVRSWYLRQQLAQQQTFSETDGLALLTDGYMIPHQTLFGLLMYAWEQYGAAREDAAWVGEVIDALSGWDGMPDVMAAEPTIFTAWLYLFAGKIFIDAGMMDWTEADIDPERGNAMLDALAEARATIEEVAGFFEIPWGLVHPIRKGSKSWPVATGQYPTISLMNANADITGGDLASLSVGIGSAYTHFHVMGSPVRSWSVLPLGQTDKPESPYCTVNTELFAQRQLKPLPFTDEEILEHKLSETVLELK